LFRDDSGDILTVSDGNNSNYPEDSLALLTPAVWALCLVRMYALCFGSNPDATIDIGEVFSSTRSIEISSSGVRVGFGGTVSW
jgi:hypothetical protein